MKDIAERRSLSVSSEVRCKSVCGPIIRSENVSSLQKCRQYHKHDNSTTTSTEEETLLVGVRSKEKVNWLDLEG